MSSIKNDNSDDSQTAIISLSVLDVQSPKDIAKSLARIDKEVMDKIGIRASSTTDNIVKLESAANRITFARCLPFEEETKKKKTGWFGSDAEKGRQKQAIDATITVIGVIRVDLLTRNNLDVEIGDTIRVSRARTKMAKRVVVSPLEQIPPIDERYLADTLDGIPLTVGDKVIVPYFGGRLEFRVIDIIMTNMLPSRVQEDREGEKEGEENGSPSSSVITKPSPANSSSVDAADYAAIVISSKTQFVIKEGKSGRTIELDLREFLRKDESDVGYAIDGFRITLAYDNGKVKEQGEFQYRFSIQREAQDNAVIGSYHVEEVTKRYERYNEIIAEGVKKAEEKILKVIAEDEKYNDDNNKVLLLDYARKLLKETKIEILTKCAEIE